MVQVRLWTILGEAQTGKSRSVRELASLQLRGGRPTFSDVLLRGGGYIRVYAKRMAWQEDKKMPADSIREIERKIAVLTRRLKRKPVAVNVLSTLRFQPIIHSSGLTCPAASKYIEAWQDKGWSVESLALMSPDPAGADDHYGELGAPTAWLYESRTMRIGEMVGTIRNHFAWA